MSSDKEIPGSLSQHNFLGPYNGTSNSFWTSVTTANPSATLTNVVGSSGINQAANTAWAVIDQPGTYAVGVQVFTVQTLTITVT